MSSLEDDSRADAEQADNVIQFDPGRNHRTTEYSLGFDDDELFQRAVTQIDDWSAKADPPSMTDMQQLFYELIRDAGSSMLRDKVVDVVIATFGSEFGGRRALIGTWSQIAKQVAADRAKAARKRGIDAEKEPLTDEQKAAIRADLWPKISELAKAPDLLDCAVHQVHSMGIVGEEKVIKLIYVSGTSRVLDKPTNPLVKGASSGGKTVVVECTLKLMGSCVNCLTSSSALSLAYDDTSLAHTIIFIGEANQIQGEGNSVFAMLLRSLVSEGRIVHQTTVDDPSSPTRRRVLRLVREGPIALVITTTGELHSENDTRMVPFHISEDQEQTRSVIDRIASRAAGISESPGDLAIWHELQQWITLGPNDAIVPFAPQIAAMISPRMVRFRRDVGALFGFIKASAILHQAQRELDSKGRVIATAADYAVAFPIFSEILAETSGQGVTPNVRAVVDCVAGCAAQLAGKATGGRFSRTQTVGAGFEVVLSSQQIGIATGLGKSAAYRALCSALELGLLANSETRSGRPYRLTVRQRIDEVGTTTLLPHPDTIALEGGVR
jgi:hypothetical protein